MRSTALAIVVVALGLFVGCGGAKAPAPDERAVSKPDSQVAAAPPKSPPADALRSASGLASKTLKLGHGEQRPKPQDKVRVGFTAWNEKGKRVDSSEERGGPEVFEVMGVIAGWTEALQQMQIGEQRRLWVPDKLSYPGRPGAPRGIVVFDLELFEIIAGEPPILAPEDVAAAPVDAINTRSDLAYKLLVSGGGDSKPHAWDRVTLRVAGWSRDGVLLDGFGNRAQPAIFDVADVMPGWREALLLLAVGDRARLWIPEQLAYQRRAGKPTGMLVFDIELLAIERRREPPRAPANTAAAPRNAKKTASGLAYRVLHHGTGTTKPKLDDRVEVDYSAWTCDGVLFDSSIMRGKPASVPLNRIIPGWAEGLQLMVEGDKALFWIPEKLAYGAHAGSQRGALVYEVELLRIAPKSVVAVDTNSGRPISTP